MSLHATAASFSIFDGPVSQLVVVIATIILLFYCCCRAAKGVVVVVVVVVVPLYLYRVSKRVGGR